MILNYLKTFIRNHRKYKTSSIVNLTGLSLAIAGCIFILLFVFDELKFDQFQKDKDNIFRYTELDKRTGEINVIMPACNYSKITGDSPEIINGFRIREYSDRTMAAGKKQFLENVYYADKEILSVFTFPLLSGDSSSALEAPFTMVISEENAIRYFGTVNVIGKTLRQDNQYDFRITGVMKNIAVNSHLRPGMILSIATLNTTQPFSMEDYRVSSCFYYFRSVKNISKEELEKRLNERIGRKFGTDWARFNRVVLERLPDIYLHPNGSEWDISRHGDARLVKSFIIIAALILLMASFNYSNMLTAQIRIREKEIAVRRIHGAGRDGIIKQFVFETLLYLATALCAALCAVLLLLPEFNRLMNKELTIGNLLSEEMIISVLTVIVLTALLSLLYPVAVSFRADNLSRLKGSQLSGHFNFSKVRFGFRQVVTAVQFIITVSLLICIGIMYRQLNYSNTTSLGFNKDCLVVVDNPYDMDMYSRFDNFRNVLKKYPQILAVSASENYPSTNISNYGYPKRRGSDGNGKVKIGLVAVDHDLFGVWQTRFLSGRNFSRSFVSDDRNCVILNESAVRALNITDPLNTELTDINNSEGPQRIIGVVEDIHFKSFKEKVMPTVYYVRQWCAVNISVRLDMKAIPAGIKILEREWKKILPDRPFMFKFVDESYNALYQTEQRTEKLIIIFCILAVIISAIGIFGLMSLIAQTRRKEIGIRKVLGGSASGIIFLIVKEFLFVIFLANVIAWPAAYYLMNNWLKDYVYRIEIGWGVFFFSAVVSLVIAVSTIGYQAVRAAFGNPVDSLKYE